MWLTEKGGKKTNRNLTKLWYKKMAHTMFKAVNLGQEKVGQELFVIFREGRRIWVVVTEEKNNYFLKSFVDVYLYHEIMLLNKMEI